VRKLLLRMRKLRLRILVQGSVDEKSGDRVRLPNLQLGMDLLDAEVSRELGPRIWLFFTLLEEFCLRRCFVSGRTFP